MGLANGVELVALPQSDDEPFEGFVQILFRERSEEVFAFLLRGLQKLAREMPELLVVASDEFHLEGEDVLEVGEPRDVLDPDLSDGGIFRAAPDPREGVYRADLPKRDPQHVARRFLDALEAEGLIEWAAPADSAVEQLARLVTQIDEGRRRASSLALEILEADPAVDEIFATDSQLDSLWRGAVNQVE